MSLNPESKNNTPIEPAQEIAQLVATCRKMSASTDSKDILKKTSDIERLSQVMMSEYMEPMRNDLANILGVNSEDIELSVEITAQVTYWRVIWRIKNLAFNTAENPEPQSLEPQPTKVKKAKTKKDLPLVISKERRAMSLIYKQRQEFLKCVTRERGGSTQPTQDGFVTMFSILF